MSVEREVDTTPMRCGPGVRLDGEICRAFHVDPNESPALVEYVCGVLAHVIATQHLVNVLGFGEFRVKLYRPVRPARTTLDSFVEAPYLGPVEFLPSALLIRQLRSGKLDRSLVPRSDPLYSAIRKDNRVPRGQIPYLIKEVFKALTASLISNRLVRLPGVGCLVVRQRPPTVRYNVEIGDVEVMPGDPALLLRISSPFSTKIVKASQSAVREKSPR